MSFLENVQRRLEFGPAQKRRVFRKLAMLLRNSVRLPEALKLLIDHQTDDGRKKPDTVAKILLSWRRAVENGRGLGEAAARDIGFVDRQLIAAGDEAGRLPDALEDAVFLQEASGRIRSAIIGGLAYPVLLLTLTVVFVLFYGLQIVPAFEGIVPRSQWYGLPLMLADISDFLMKNMIVLAVCAIALAGVVIWSLPRWTGRLRVIADRYPPWSLYRLSQGVGFMLSLAALVQAGVKVSDALKMLMRGASPWLEERLRAALRHVNNGHNIGTALLLAKHDFPNPEFVRDLRAYADLEGFEEILNKIAREWLHEAVDGIKKQMAIVFNLSLVIMGLVFGAIAMAIMEFQGIISQVL